MAKQIKSELELVQARVLPAKGKTLHVKINIPGQAEDKEISRFWLRQDDPVYGGMVFWGTDEQSVKEKSFKIDNLEPGRYYTVVYYDGRTYHSPVDITDESEEFGFDWAIEVGDVTLSGNLPPEVNHLWFTDKDRTFYDIVSSKADGRYSIEGLLPGEYFFSLKKIDFNDSIAVTVLRGIGSTYDFELEQLRQKLRDDLFVYVADADGYPVENADVWVECDGKVYRPAWHDGYSGRFYLPGGECTIHAEKGEVKVEKAFRFNVDQNNTAGMESHETFIQFQKETAPADFSK